MLHDSESLDEVFSFLSQIDLPVGLTDLEHDDNHEMLSRPVDFVPAPGAEDCSFEELFKPQTLEPSFDESTTKVLTPGQGSNFDLTASTTSPTSSEASTEQVKTDTTETKKPKRIRISRKQQIDTLRGTVQELSTELQSLLPQWQSGPESQRGGQLIPRQGGMWQEIAARQLEHREQSEQENAKLRQMLQLQIHEARNLRRVLKRRTKIEMMEDMLGMKRQKILEFGVPEDNPQVFEDMLQNMDELYVGVDTLFVQKGMYELPIPGRKSEPRRNVNNGLFLEILQRHMVPFDLKTTEQAVWKIMSQILFEGLNQVRDLHPRTRFHDHHVEKTNNTLKTSFFVETAHLGDVKGAQFRKVVRKYVESDRVVLICKNLMQPLLGEKGKSSGFHTTTTLRIVIRKDNAVTGQASLIESHFSATRHDEGLPSSRALRTPANLDTGVAAWDEAISRIVVQVESLAIDESCEKISRPVLP